MDRQRVERSPQRMRSVSGELEEAYRCLQKAKEDLKRVPADDVVAPLVLGLQELNRSYGEQSAKAIAESETHRLEQNRLSDLRRKLAQEADALSQEASEVGRVRMISKVQSVLDEFRESLLARKFNSWSFHNGPASTSFLGKLTR